MVILHILSIVFYLLDEWQEYKNRSWLELSELVINVLEKRRDKKIHKILCKKSNKKNEAQSMETP